MITPQEQKLEALRETWQAARAESDRMADIVKGASPELYQYYYDAHMALLCAEQVIKQQYDAMIDEVYPPEDSSNVPAF